MENLQLPPSLLKPNPWNSNIVGPEMEARLEESIRRFGVYKPIVVRELEDGIYEILGGEHRARTAGKLGIETVPVANLGRLNDSKAKAIGLADNGRYGEDDALKLSQILRDVGADAALFLPFDEKDLAGIFASEDIDLDSLGLDDSDDSSHDLPSLAETRAGATHELMRFKVPVEDREMVQKLVDRVIKTRGLHAEEDSLVAAGMALVELAKAAKDAL